MKQSFNMGVAAIFVAVVGTACSAEVTESNMEEELAGKALEARGARALPGDLADDSNEDVGSSSDALSFGCEARVLCTVVKTLESAYCPNEIGGDGRTTFLGSCAKARRKARENAQSKLPAGCAISSCETL